MGGSGWRSDLHYDEMERVAREKKPEDRFPWEQNMIDTADEAEFHMKLDQHWSYVIFQYVIGVIMLIPVIGIVYALLTFVLNL